MCENFNPRSLTGATWLSRRRQDWLQYFNPRSLAGATLRPSLMLILEIMYFNPRSLTGATGGGIVAQLLEQFQSTLPHGSDADEHLLQAVLRISIHAPSRERPGAHPAPCRARHFNPRSLSGATGPSAVACDWSRYFNPRSLAGATLLCRLSSMLHLFQSTLPSGSDGFWKINSITCQNFNPRSLAGATTRKQRNICAAAFQSTLPCGSDGEMYRAGYANRAISIHAPSRERPYGFCTLQSNRNFNPRSLAGATASVN